VKSLYALNRFRRTDAAVMQMYGDVGDDTAGVFEMPSPDDPTGRTRLHIIASAGGGWDHVSVSIGTRCPTWSEMEFVKREFFKDDETAMQLHVPPSDHVNCHPNCLHLWRPQIKTIPRPPQIMVGPATAVA